MKATIYELLGMIKDGKAPKTIKSEGHYYKYNELEKDYYEGMGYDYEYLLANTSVKGLNDEVEIVDIPNNIRKYIGLLPKEEKKIPEKLKIEDDGNTITLFGEKENEWTILDNVDVIICNKINSIIDYLKSKGE